MSIPLKLAMGVELVLVCDNFGRKHLVELRAEFEADPGPAALGAFEDAQAALLERAKDAGWLIDPERRRCLCPACATQAGGGW